MAAAWRRESGGPGIHRHRLDGYLALWVPSPPGKHTLRTSQFRHILKQFARKRLGTRWAKYPLSRCRQACLGSFLAPLRRIIIIMINSSSSSGSSSIGSSSSSSSSSSRSSSSGNSDNKSKSGSSSSSSSPEFSSGLPGAPAQPARSGGLRASGWCPPSSGLL